MTESLNLHLHALDIEAYLDQLASSASTPGGGAVAGLSGAQAAALLCMVCNLSTGDAYQEVDQNISEINQSCEIARHDLVNLANADARVFNDVMHAYKLPKSTPEQKSNRIIAIQVALKSAAEVPLQVMQKTCLLLPNAEKLADIGNSNLISDIGVAVHLIDATIRSAQLNILINTRLLKDLDNIHQFDISITKSMDVLKQYKTKILDKVAQRMS